jgi:hypothetical protein
MTRHRRLPLPSATGITGLVLTAIATLATGGGAMAQQVDLLLTNGKIYVGGDGAPAYADVVAVKDGAIVFVGAGDAASSMQAAETIDLEGRLVLPGFVDAHVHAADAGIAAGQCSLAEADDLAGSDRIIRDCLAAEPPAPGEWFEVIMASFVGQHIPIGHWDELRSDGPLIIRGLDYHTLYANTAALKAAGITAETSTPEGGSMDLSQGFFADAAMELVTEAMPEPTAEETQASYLAGAAYGMRYLNGVGVTSIREAYATEPQLDAYARLAREGKVTVRSEQSIPVHPKAEPKGEIAKAMALRQRFAGTPYMTVRSIKVFADGVIEFPAQTAALLQPYLDPATGRPGTKTGELLFDPATIDALFAEADRQGFDIHVHAIGDGAANATLDAFETLRKQAAPDKRKLSIAHLELIDPGDFGRFAALSVSPNFQLLWAEPDAWTVESLLPHLGADRHRWLYPAGSLYQAKAPLSLGSDWPVSIPDPLWAIQTAVLRTNPEKAGGYTFAVANVGEPTDYIRGFDGRFFAALHEEERLPIQGAIDAYTIGSARELRLDDQVGSIAVGKRADLVVLDRNVFEVAATAPAEIGAIRVCRTFFDGKQVYSDGDAQAVFAKAPSPTCD